MRGFVVSLYGGIGLRGFDMMMIMMIMMMMTDSG